MRFVCLAAAFVLCAVSVDAAPDAGGDATGEGWASLAGRDEHMARQLATQRAYEDLVDRIEGIAFFWGPGMEPKFMSRAPRKTIGAPYDAKIAQAGKTDFGMYKVTASARAPAGKTPSSDKRRIVRASASAPIDGDPAAALARARRLALKQVIAQAMPLYFAIHRQDPRLTQGRVFPAGRYQIGLGKNVLLLSLSAYVAVGGPGGGAPASGRNILVEVALASGGQAFRHAQGSRWVYRGGDAVIRYGRGRMGKSGLNAKLRSGRLSGRTHMSQDFRASAGSGAMTLMVQDGTTGYLDVGTWVPMSLPFRIGGFDPVTGKPTQYWGTVPYTVHAGAQLAVHAVIVGGDRVRLTLAPQFSSLSRSGRGVRTAGAGVTVTARDGQSVSVGGLTWRSAGAAGRSGRAASRTLSFIVTPHIR